MWSQNCEAVLKSFNKFKGKVSQQEGKLTGAKPGVDIQTLLSIS